MRQKGGIAGYTASEVESSMLWLEGLAPVGQGVAYSSTLSEIGTALKNNKHTKTSHSESTKQVDQEESKLSSSISTIRLDESPCLPDSNFSSYNSAEATFSVGGNLLHKAVSPLPQKELSVEFLGRDDLLITCVREFLEILVISVQRGTTFHQEIVNPKYTHVGVSLLKGE